MNDTKDACMIWLLGVVIMVPLQLLLWHAIVCVVRRVRIKYDTTLKGNHHE